MADPILGLAIAVLVATTLAILLKPEIDTMLTYLRARAAEVSTWLGDDLIGAALASLWIWRVEIWHAAAAAIGAVLMALPGRVLAMVWPLIEQSADLPPAAPESPHLTRNPPENQVMGLFSEIESIFESKTAASTTNFAVQAIDAVTGSTALTTEARKVLLDAKAAIAQGGVMPWVKVASDAAETIVTLTGQISALQAQLAELRAATHAPVLPTPPASPAQPAH